MRSFFLLALICAISTVAYSQNRYVAGSIVHQDGSKETGWIQNGEWQISPELIKFKKTETSKAKKYEPKDLVSFSVENGLYFTRKIEIENSTFRVKNLTYDSEFKITEKHAFVQLLVDGDKKLFKYVTKSDNNLFYIEKDGELEILLFKKYFEDKDGKRFVREKKNYVSQLYTLLEDCDNVRAWVQDIKYTEGGLTKLFQDYHECIGSKTLYVKAKPSYGLRFSVLGGFSQNDMYFDAFSPKYIIDAEFNSNLGYIGGLGLEIVFPQFGKNASKYISF